MQLQRQASATTEYDRFACSLPQNQVSTGFALGPHGNFTHDQTVILKQVYDRITQKDCVDFVNGILAENKVSKDLNELWKLTNKAVLNRWNGNLTAQDLGISAGEVKDIQTGFAGNKAERNKAERGQIKQKGVRPSILRFCLTTSPRDG